MSKLMAKHIYQQIVDLMDEADQKFTKAEAKHAGWFDSKLVTVEGRILGSLELCVQWQAKSDAVALMDDFKNMDGAHESVDQAMELSEEKLDGWFDSKLVKFQALLEVYRESMVRAITKDEEKRYGK